MLGVVWSVCVLSVLGVVTAGSDTLYFKPEGAAAEQPHPTSVVCPDQGTCKDGETCCLNPSGKYGCCPWPKAVCCSDKTHCCPNGYVCNVPKAMCDPAAGTRNSSPIPWVAKTAATPLPTNVVCPDKGTCKDGDTCCLNPSGKYGCCPLPKAVCCSDKTHCCPNGYVCNPATAMCDPAAGTRSSSPIPWVAKTAATPLPTSVVCPDKQGTCPDGETCCLMPSGKYGCCPLPKAVCCSDHSHCCPTGYVCNVPKAMCDPAAGTRSSSPIPWVAKTPATPVPDNLCPGGKSSCPDGSTCCKQKSGTWGCCPMPQATCCSDGLHCCPQGYTCDITKSTCKKGIVTLTMRPMAEAKIVNNPQVPKQKLSLPDNASASKVSANKVTPGKPAVPQQKVELQAPKAAPSQALKYTPAKSQQAQTGNIKKISTPQGSGKVSQMSQTLPKPGTQVLKMKPKPTKPGQGKVASKTVAKSKKTATKPKLPAKPLNLVGHAPQIKKKAFVQDLSKPMTHTIPEAPVKFPPLSPKQLHPQKKRRLHTKILSKPVKLAVVPKSKPTKQAPKTIPKFKLKLLVPKKLPAKKKADVVPKKVIPPKKIISEDAKMPPKRTLKSIQKLSPKKQKLPPKTVPKLLKPPKKPMAKDAKKSTKVPVKQAVPVKKTVTVDKATSKPVATKDIPPKKLILEDAKMPPKRSLKSIQKVTPKKQKPPPKTVPKQPPKKPMAKDTKTTARVPVKQAIPVKKTVDKATRKPVTKQPVNQKTAGMDKKQPATKQQVPKVAKLPKATVKKVPPKVAPSKAKAAKLPLKTPLKAKSQMAGKLGVPKTITKSAQPKIARSPKDIKSLAKAAQVQLTCVKIKSRMNIDLETYTTQCTQKMASESLKEARARAMTSPPSKVKFKAKVQGRQSKVMAGKKKYEEDNSIVAMAKSIMKSLTRFIGLSDQGAKAPRLTASAKLKQKQLAAAKQKAKMKTVPMENLKTQKQKAANAVAQQAQAKLAKAKTQLLAKQKQKTVQSPKTKQANVVPTKAKQAKVVPKAKEPKLVPKAKQPQPKIVPKGMQAKVVHKAKQAKVVPKAKQPKVVPKAKQAKVVPKPKQAKVVPKHAKATQLLPKAKAKTVLPKVKQAKVLPSTKQAKVIPKAKQAKVVPKAQQAKLTPKPKATPVKASLKTPQAKFEAKKAPKVQPKPSAVTKAGKAKRKVPVLLPHITILEPKTKIKLKVSPKAKSPIVVKIPPSVKALSKGKITPRVSGQFTIKKSREHNKIIPARTEKPVKPKAKATTPVPKKKVSPKPTGRKLLSIETLEVEEEYMRSESHRGVLVHRRSKKAVKSLGVEDARPPGTVSRLLLRKRTARWQSLSTEGSFPHKLSLALLIGTPQQADEVTCLDKSTCPDGSTCCKMTGGAYGCCPMKDAVCCDDLVHCCPHGTKCNTAASTCDSSEYSVPWSEKVPAVQAEESATPVGDDIKCEDKVSTCPVGTTCCKMQSGWYGCCPKKNAVCCSDHLHCCEEGETCDVEKGLCKKGLLSSAWGTKFPATPAPSLGEVKCPDGESSCPDGTTCCQLASGQYGCCPMPNATCCSDHLHCCPEGTACDVERQTCKKGDISFPMLIEISATVSDVVCPDKTSSCPTDTTCCQLASGQYGCCPFPKAVCCSDHQHCCPEGYTCDVSAGSCKSGNSVVPFAQKLPSTPVGFVVCPDQTSKCPDETTCCKMDSGVYSCCPYPQAVCCSDHKHCCPNGYTCDDTTSSCFKGDLTAPLLKKMEPALSVGYVICPDGTSQCPSGTTCCKLATGQYGCCPLPNAVCCSDGVHCCPNGYQCDVSSGACFKSTVTVSIPWSEKVPARLPGSTVTDVVCPGGEGDCPDGSTCCKLASGKYGCCPYPKAVCCSDHLHCCPEGMTCDVSEGKCNSALTVPLEKMEPTLSVGNVVCPGGGSECPSGTTCCKLASGQYGCCPIPNAVCCPDHVHCCPNGYQCDVSSGACFKSTVTVSIPWSEKVPARLPGATVTDVVCPGGEGDCPDGSTCCKLASGKYGCCPFPKAVCCSDHLHCCPEGMTCDVSEGKCNSVSNSLSISWDAVRKQGTMAPSVSAVKCKDGTECPWGSTCCALEGGKYGCCPMPNAVCCDDHIHCCPEDYKCDTKNSTCSKSGTSLTVPMTLHSRSQARAPIAGPLHKTCPDNSTCDSGSTCCKMISGAYGCCPMSPASCCKDGVHCCPEGTVCDEKSSKCKQAIPFFTKIPATQIPVSLDGIATATSSVVCPDRRHQCPDFNTCCMMQGGSWGCCPLPKARCCRDGKHCCPDGYHCTEKTCMRGPHPGEGSEENEDSTPAFLLYEGETIN